MIVFKKLLFAAILAVSFNSAASDLAKEKRWADQVVDAILDGEAIWLDDGTSKFLGIYTEAGNDKNRAVIVMHGTGIHPDWQQVIQPLRVGLTEHDWHTLSIQMPILPNEAEYSDYAPLYDEVAPRIDAAIGYLQDNGIEKIVLIGHSQGAAMTAYYLSSSKQKLDGFVAVGMGAFAEDPRMNSIKALENIKIPILDIYGDDDLEDIMKSVKARAEAANKAGNQDYTQVEVAASNHFFDDTEEALVEAVAAWLEKR
jgi:pimeloyl-ACP methyl ester carboxylesterase